MNYNYLDKVVNQIVDETIVNGGEIVAPFTSRSPPFLASLSFSSFLFSELFEKYCIGIYGLTKEEVKYVWDEYKQIIKDIIIDSRI